MGVYGVRVAFRVGLNATDTADSIKRSDSPTESWACVVSGRNATEIEQCISQFNEKLVSAIQKTFDFLCSPATAFASHF